MRYVERPSKRRGRQRALQRGRRLRADLDARGFCLPPLEAIATGGAVVCTDSHGNRDFCVDGENCLMPAAGVEAVSAAVARLLGDAGLRERLGAAGSVTAQEYAGSGGSTRWRGSWRGWGGTQRTGCSLTARRDC